MDIKKMVLELHEAGYSDLEVSTFTGVRRQTVYRIRTTDDPNVMIATANLIEHMHTQHIANRLERVTACVRVRPA